MADDSWRKIPSVNKLRNSLLELFPHITPEFIVWFIQAFLFDLKKKNSQLDEAFSEAILIKALSNGLERMLKGSIEPLINGTGIVLHTGLGRAPLDNELIQSAAKILSGYLQLEFDLQSGGRGDRNFHNSELLRFLTGAEDHAIVNNNAAAVLLSLTTLGGAGSEAIVSRGQLVEIGGAFRIPDVMKQSGTVMIEVGTTNRTHLRDYRLAISPRTKMIFVAHTSNYQIQGFTAQPSLRELLRLAHQHGLPLVYDLGSGLLRNMSYENIRGEETVKELMAAGVDLCTFSGDKLLGGPQAGIIAGKREILTKIRSHPLMRAVRCDKVILTLFQQTILQYVQKDVPQILTHRLLSQTEADLQSKADEIFERIPEAIKKEITLENRPVEAGSGSAPLQQIASLSLSFPGYEARLLAERFRSQVRPPLIGYIHKERFYIDLRTILPQQIATVAAHIVHILEGVG
jgi:L-seryl-tRNA(Ser) seleniumtransferase